MSRTIHYAAHRSFAVDRLVLKFKPVAKAMRMSRVVPIEERK